VLDPVPRPLIRSGHRAKSLVCRCDSYHQVGKQNKDGTPVKRERDAIEDIDGSTGGSVPVEFHPYNTCPARPSTGAGS
jgi:hypothetical protein